MFLLYSLVQNACLLLSDPFVKPLFHSDTQLLSDHSFLITGGAGFIGSHVAEYLLQYGARKVRVLDNMATGSPQNIDLLAKYSQFEFIEGDIRSKADCMSACDGIDFVSHQAALGSVPRSVKDPSTTNEVNISGFVNILDACRLQGIKRVVYASSSSVYGDSAGLPKVEDRIGRPLSPYALTKFTNEMYADVFGRVYGLELIGLRYFNVFGPRQSPNGPYAAVIPLFIKGLLAHEPVFINGDGNQSRDFTYVDNAVQANIKAIFVNNTNSINQVYNVAVGQRFTLLEMYRLLSEIIGTNLPPLHRAPREGDIPHSLADISKAQTLLGYQPFCFFEEGLRQTVAYFQSNLNLL